MPVAEDQSVDASSDGGASGTSCLSSTRRMRVLRRPSIAHLVPGAMELPALASPGTHASFKIVGGRRRLLDDICYMLLRSRWEVFSLVLVSGFMIFNVLFAGLFCIDPHGLSGGDGSFQGFIPLPAEPAL